MYVLRIFFGKFKLPLAILREILLECIGLEANTVAFVLWLVIVVLDHYMKIV
jgi:hypothetical protein